MFDSRTGAYHALNLSGAAIWRAIAAGMDEDEAVESLAVMHEVQCEAIAADVRVFIADALARELLIEIPA